MQSQPIPPEQFTARRRRIQEFLTERELGALLVYSPAHEHKWGQTGHVAWLAGWGNCDRIVDSAVVVPQQGEPVLLLAGMDFMFEQAAEVSPIAEMRLAAAVDPNAVAGHRKDRSGATDFAGQALEIIAANGITTQRVGVVGLEVMPLPFFEALAAGLGDDLVRVEDIVAQLRAVKTSEEVALMRRAAELSDLGYRTMLEVARPGMRGIEIIAEMERAVRREGADHAMYWMASGPPPDWNRVRLDLKPHERVLEYGDLMASCSYVVYKGYWCHGQRTGTLGKSCPELDELCRITRDAQDRALELMVPGEPIAAMGRTVREKAEANGLELQGGRIGHGMGLDYSEQPVPLNDANQTRWQAGTTAVIHSVFGLPGGKMFVPLGDLCHVTDDGPELLMDFQRTPFVAGA